MSTGSSITAQEVGMEFPAPGGEEVVRVLDRLSLSVPAGGSVAVIGPSGCGKSTLLGLLGALDVPSSGRVLIGGQEVSALPEDERAAFRRRNLGFVFQADNLQPFLTVLENVVLQSVLSGRSNDGARAEELLVELGLGELLHRLPDQLSGGQRQRVAVARALVHRPGVVLADEPTGALDAATSERVINLLLEARERLGFTLALVTHDPVAARRMDDTVRMHDGRFIEPEAVLGVG